MISRSCSNPHFPVSWSSDHPKFLKHFYKVGKNIIITHIWIYDDILCITLWADYSRAGSTFLFFVYPTLYTTLVNPFRSSSTVTRFYPGCCCVVFVSCKTDPTVPFAYRKNKIIVKFFCLIRNHSGSVVQC